MSFTQLRKNREARQLSSFAQRTPLDKELKVPGRSSQSDHSVSEEWLGSSGLYQDIPEFVEVRTSDAGRGLYVRSESERTIKAGERLVLLVKPPSPDHVTQARPYYQLFHMSTSCQLVI